MKASQKVAQRYYCETLYRELDYYSNERCTTSQKCSFVEKKPHAYNATASPLKTAYKHDFVIRYGTFRNQWFLLFLIWYSNLTNFATEIFNRRLATYKGGMQEMLISKRPIFHSSISLFDNRAQFSTIFL